MGGSSINTGDPGLRRPGEAENPQKPGALRKSKFRSKFKLTQKDRDYVATKGLETIQEHAYQFINSRVAPGIPKNDGKQTPMRGHPVYVGYQSTKGFGLKAHNVAKRWNGMPFCRINLRGKENPPDHIKHIKKGGSGRKQMMRIRSLDELNF